MGVLDHVELTNSHLLGIMSDKAPSNYMMTRELQSTLEAPGIELPALRIHIPCMAHIIQLAFGRFMSSLGVKCQTKSWEAHERDQQFGQNENIDIGKGQRLRKEGNARFNTVLPKTPGLGKMIQKVRISTNFKSPETDSDRAGNASCVGCADTESSKWVHWLTKSQNADRSTTCYGWEDMMEFNIGVTWASLPITRIHLRVAQHSKMQWVLANLDNTGWMDDRQVCHGWFQAIPRLDPVDVDMGYHDSASRNHCLQWDVR